jgi:hypothetical protein
MSVDENAQLLQQHTYQKPTYTRHICTMLLLHYCLAFRETLVFPLFYARILPVLGYYTILYYYLRKSCVYMCIVRCIYTQLSERGKKGS